MDSAFELKIDSEGIARLIFDRLDVKMNTLSEEALDQLDQKLDEISNNKSVKALLLSSGKEGSFCAGADLNNIKKIFGDPELGKAFIAKGHAVFNKLESLSIPTIALINGICLGGGLELSLSCKYRVATDHPKTSIGLPEVNLGIYPAWGGTQRLPRLIGVQKGVEMIVTGKAVDAKKAFKNKVVDAIIPWQFAEEKINEFVQLILTEKGRKSTLSRRQRTGIGSLLLEKNPLGRALLYSIVRKNILKKTKGFYQAPLYALKVIKSTYTLPLKKGLEKEYRYFFDGFSKELKDAPNLMRLFFNSEIVKKDSGAVEEGAAHPVSSAGVLGAGTMGSGISWLFSYRDIPVRMKDINWEAIGKGLAGAWNSYKALMKIRKLKKPAAILKFLKIGGTVDYSGFSSLDLVVEAATENLDLKKKIFGELEQEVSKECIIGTNTSSLTISALAPSLKHPERLVGMHFFNPPARMPLVEIVKGEKTSPDAVATAVELCRKLKKTPIVVGDCPGFLVNRIFVIGAFQMFRMLESGVPMEKIEKTMLKFGMPMGPFYLADEVGVDVNLKVLQIFAKAYGDRISVPSLLEKMVEKNLLGKKVGKGFYTHKNKKFNPEVQEMLPKEKSNLTSEEIVQRTIYTMINEASRCLAEGVVKSPAHLDIALVFGTGFPPFRGGLLAYADTVGISKIVDKLKELAASEGAHFAPSEALLEMQKTGATFYE